MSSPLKLADPVSAIAGAVGGLGQIATGIFGSRRRKREARAAAAELQEARQGLIDTTFTNQFSGLDNPFEDMQVNLQASQFQAQQTDQALAQGLDAAVQSGGGATGSAQAIADAALRSKQNIAADIARQESANQKMAADAQMQLDFRAAQSADDIQLRNYDKQQQLLNMAAARKQAADQARAQATAAITSGLGSLAGSAAAGNFNTE